MIAGGEEGGFEPVHRIQHQTENSSLLHHNPILLHVQSVVKSAYILNFRFPQNLEYPPGI